MRREDRAKRWEGLGTGAHVALKVAFPVHADGTRMCVDVRGRVEIDPSDIRGRAIIGVSLDLTGTLILDLGEVLQ